MKKTYMAILTAAVAGLSATDAQALDPETWDVPAETWEISYDHYQSLLSNDPIYKNQSRTVTIKRDNRFMYIKGIFEEYPDTWVMGRRYSKSMILENGQELSATTESPAYLLGGNAKFVTQSNTDREYTVGAYTEVAKTKVWLFADDGADQDLLLPNSENSLIWIGSNPKDTWSISRTYHFDTTVTGSDFGPMPAYLNPTFRKVSESGIQDNVIDEQRPEDNRVFDLNGRQVNPDRLTPGIYIRAGRKFIVR